MLSPREFLLQECSNVEELLRDALRYEYGPGGSRDFFDECFARLNTIIQDSRTLTDQNTREIAFYAQQLSHLSQLIAQIERSHIGEFPWAFGECLKTAAEQLLTESSLARAGQIKKAGHPLLFIMAEGGLSAFEARKDTALPELCNRRVFTIVVPRSLKNHVLLHAVLGHEVCHSAIWTEKVRSYVNSATKALGVIEPLRSAKKLKTWAEDHYPELGTFPDSQVDKIRQAWIRELKCDLFGLVFMGPAYLAAVRTMLGLSDPTGNHVDAGHPPHVWRYQMLEYAYKALDWDKPLPASVSKPVRDGQQRFNDALFTYNREAMATDEVVPKKEVGISACELRKLLDDHGGFDYHPPRAEVLETLIQDIKHLRPPIGQSVTDDDVTFARAEFRQVLHVGWLSYHADVSKDWHEDQQKDRFTIINRLCEQAIIQERAIMLTRGSNIAKEPKRRRRGNKSARP